MVSTAPPDRDDAESHHRQADPQQEEEENWSDDPQSEMRREKSIPSKRQPKLRHKKPEHYRTHTSEHQSQIPDDPYMRQARNETVPYTYNPNPFPPYAGTYQANTMPPAQPLYGVGAQPSAGYGYPSPYTYPGSSDYFTVPRASVQNPQYFGQPGPYNTPSTGYFEPDYGLGDYRYGEEAPPFPEYPAQDPNRTPVRPKASRQPKPQAQRDPKYIYTGEPVRQPRKKRPPMSKREKMPSEGDITNTEIMHELRRLQRQVDKANAEIQSDPGRRDGRRYASPPTSSHFTLDDTRSLNMERQRSDHLTSIIYRLLEDRRREGYQDSYAGTSRRNLADLLQDRIEMENRETGLIHQRDTRDIETKLDTILEYLQLENRLESPPEPQRLTETYNIRLGPRSTKGQQSVVSGSSVHEPASPTLSRAPPRRSDTYPAAGKQRQESAQPSNQARVRQKLPRTPDPEPEEEHEELFEEYEQQEVPVHIPMRSRRMSSNQSIASQDKLRRQSSVGQRSEVRPPVRKIVEGDQQKVRSGHQAFVETDDQESDDEEPVPGRPPMPYHQPPKVPDPPGQGHLGRRRSSRSVRFGGL